MNLIYRNDTQFVFIFIAAEGLHVSKKKKKKAEIEVEVYLSSILVCTISVNKDEE